jgi:hypothetical protein
MKEKTMVRLPYFADPENLKVEDEEQQLVLPEGTTAKEALRMVYRGEIVLSPQQMRAAIESLPYETPKLSATAIATMDGKSFAEALDRCIARSKAPLALNAPVIEHEPMVQPSEMKRPFSRYRRY